MGKRTEAPLSFNQLTALDKAQRWGKQGRTYAHNVTARLDVDGAIDVAVLSAAARDVLARHDILRTGYGSRESIHYGFLSESSVPVVHASRRVGLSDSGLDECVRNESLEPFDLADPPQLRIKVLQHADEKSTLVVVVPHIACDAQSMQIVINDLAFAYSARCGGERPRWPSQAQPYSTFALWQHERANCDSPAMRYWRARLDPLQPLPEYRLPTAVQPPLESRTAASITNQFPRLDSEEFERAARRLRVTPYVLCAAAVSLAMARTGGSNVVGVVSSAGLRPPEWHNSVGWFAQTFLLRQEVPSDVPLLDFVKQTRSTMVEAVENALPPRAILASLAPHRSIKRPWEPQVYLDVLDGRGKSDIRFGGFSASEVANATVPILRDGLAMWWIVGGHDGLRVFAQYERESVSATVVSEFVNLVADFLAGMMRAADSLADAQSGVSLPE